MSNIYLNSFYLENVLSKLFSKFKKFVSRSVSNEEFPRDYLINIATYLFAYYKINIKQWSKTCLKL